MELPEYLRSVQQAEMALAHSYEHVATSRASDPEGANLFRALAGQGREHALALGPLLERYERDLGAGVGMPLEAAIDPGLVSSQVPLLELQDLYLSACLVDMSWTVLMPIGRGLEDRDLIRVIEHCTGETGKQLVWIKSRIQLVAHPALLRPARHRRRPPSTASPTTATGSCRNRP